MIRLGPGGIRGLSSRDGYHWTELDKPLISKPPASDVQSLWFNKVDGRYIITFKSEVDASRRTVCIAESEDRFASITAGFMECQLLTKPMTWPGGDLLLNASTNWRADGSG